MPATRAVDRSSQKATRAARTSLASDAAVKRAASFGGHSSSNDSLESGRDRRRRGKQKMQLRILELEGRIKTLLAVIHQLAPSHADHDTPPVLFDVFDLTDDTASVGCQTVISVPHRQPDVFCFVDNSGALIPLRAGADAAAGDHHHDGVVGASLASSMTVVGCQSQVLDFSSQTLDVSGHVASVSHARQAPDDVCTSGGLRQAHDDDNAVHRTTCATGVPETGVLSQFAATQDVRQAHDVDNAVHRTISATDASETCDLSQSTATQAADDLAEQCGPLPSTHTYLMSLEKAPLGGELETDVESPGGIKSLEKALEACIATVGDGLVASPDDVFPGRQFPLSRNSKTSSGIQLVCEELETNVESPKGIESLEKAPFAEELETDVESPGGIESLEMAPIYESPVVCVATAGLSEPTVRDRGASSMHLKDVNVKDVNSEALASQSATSSPTSERVQDFEHTLDDIIDIFNRRRKFTSGVLSSAVTSVRGAAAMRGVDITAYRTYITSRSPRLSASIFE